MEITRQQSGDILTLKLAGRLDATWSGHVQTAISTGIRSGAHRIHLDMSEVPYLSSAGISALLNAYKELGAIQGELRIPRYSEAVRTVLDLSGLGNLLSGESILPPATSAAADTLAHINSEHAVYEVHKLGDFPPQKYSLIGDPTLLPRAGFSAAQSKPLEFPHGSVGIGLGAFGSDCNDCASRFGEVLAVAGAGASQPTDGSETPDYIVSTEALVPKFNLLYGIASYGHFSHLLRFEPKAESDRSGLEEIARIALETSGSSVAVVVLVAESVSLVGAALQRPPVAAVVTANAESSVFTFPQVRDWFSFTAERAYSGGVSVVVGIVAKNPPAALAPFVRPIGRDLTLQGHFHVAAFSYRPLQRGNIPLKETIHYLFQHQNLHGLLHLLGDLREVNGAGESEFFRGACWVAAAEAD